MAENRMIPEMRPTPVRAPSLLETAKILRHIRDFGNKAQIPQGVPLVGGQGVGDMLIGKAPEEFENLGYGNLPMQVPPMTNVPQFKRGRAESVVDALGVLPGVGTTMGGAGNAMITAAGNPRLILARASDEYGVQAGMTANQYRSPGYGPQRGATSPSFAIAQDALPDAFGDVYVLPHPRAVDPAKNPDSVLYNVDAFTGPKSPDTNDTRFMFEAPPDSDDYIVRIAASPRYNSLAHFEKSATGAGSIGSLNRETGLVEGSTNEEAFKKVITQLNKTIPNWRDMIDIGSMEDQRLFNPFILERLQRKAPKAFQKLAPEIYKIRRAGGVGQGHAELKVLGDFPYSGDTIQQVLYPGPSNPSFSGRAGPMNEMLRLLEQRGIPAMPYSSYEEAVQQARDIQQRAKF